MATPIIDSVVANPSTVVPGGNFVVTILAHDPDNRQLTLQATVIDVNGQSGSAIVPIVISDPISYALLDNTNAGFIITSRAGQPGVFDVKAP